MTTGIINTHFALTPLLGQLQEHSELVSKAGLSSEQASEIVFHPLRVSNENDFMEMRELTMKSECCRSGVVVNNNDQTYCRSCGEFCQAI